MFRLAAPTKLSILLMYVSLISANLLVVCAVKLTPDNDSIAFLGSYNGALLECRMTDEVLSPREEAAALLSESGTTTIADGIQLYQALTGDPSLSDYPADLLDLLVVERQTNLELHAFIKKQASGCHHLRLSLQKDGRREILPGSRPAGPPFHGAEQLVAIEVSGMVISQLEYEMPIDLCRDHVLDTLVSHGYTIGVPSPDDTTVYASNGSIAFLVSFAAYLDVRHSTKVIVMKLS